MNVYFSKWFKLPNRNEYRIIPNSSGVYIIARCVEPGSQVDALDNRIIYIGRTKNLRNRIKQFDDSCAHYYGGHAGGNALHKTEVNQEFRGIIENIKQQQDGQIIKKIVYKCCSESSPKIQEIWHNIKCRLSLAIWTPDDGGEGKCLEISGSEQLKFVEVYLQASFFVTHERLPEYNRRIG